MEQACKNKSEPNTSKKVQLFLTLGLKLVFLTGLELFSPSRQGKKVVTGCR